MVHKKPDVVIVGAGPAGLFAAREIAESGHSILIIDMGQPVDKRVCPMKITGKCANHTPCHIMCGVGGAGTYSDGLLNLRYDIGGDLSQYVPVRKAQRLVDEVDKVFCSFGAPGKVYGLQDEGVRLLKERARNAGVKFINIPQRHIGSDNAPRVISGFYDSLKDAGVEFMLATEVRDLLISGGKCSGVILKGGRKIMSKAVLLAPGRVGAGWGSRLMQDHGIRYRFGAIDVGVRVEVPSSVLEPVIRVSRDPKFHITTGTYNDFVRTFCTNHQGYVVLEKYDHCVGVNGHSLIGKKSSNTNFAFLTRLRLTQPVEDAIQYGKSIADLATTIGGGRPVIQKLGNLLAGRRSHPKDIRQNKVQPTLKDVTPGDISMAMPHRIVTDIVEGLKRLDKVIPGVNRDSTLLYAPEIKYYATQANVDRRMMTSVRNLFAAGDGMGLSRDIVNAAATGILAGKGVAKTLVK